MTTEPNIERRIDIPGTSNLRDIGGYAATGGTVASGRLYRSEVLVASGTEANQAHWRAECADAYTALGVRTVIDLRAEHESSKTPTAWPDATGALLIALPIAEGGEGSDTNYMQHLLSGELAQFGEPEMAAFYRDTLGRRAEQFAAAVRVLADEAALPVLVHCSAGKDRTGLLIALVLEVLGTPRADVVADYGLTGLLRPNRVDAYADRLRAAGRDPEIARVLFETPASAMHAALEHLDERYGGADGYLREAGGLTEAELDRVRRNLVVASSATVG